MKISPKATILLILIIVVVSLSSCRQESRTGQEDEFINNISTSLSIKGTGQEALTYELRKNKPSNNQGWFKLVTSSEIPVEVYKRVDKVNINKYRVKIRVKALDNINFNLHNSLELRDIRHKSAQFLLPGFWYRKNLRSPDNAPSMRKGDSWVVREDRLSSPLAGGYNPETKSGYTVLRTDSIFRDSGLPEKEGEIILAEITDLGGIGFGIIEENASLEFGFPYIESPYSYRRKLWLAPPISSFYRLKKDEERSISWEVNRTDADDYSDFVKKVWLYTYNNLKPQPIKNGWEAEEVKKQLTKFYKQSYNDEYKLKGFSGVHLQTSQCENRALLEVGFVGRVLLNAFNAVEYGWNEGDDELKGMGYSVFESYLHNGLTSTGMLREWVDLKEDHYGDVFSIRRQSEGLYALLLFLDFELGNGRRHNEWEDVIVKQLENLIYLVREDFSLPRKFDNSFHVIDSTGGSSSSFVLPLVMAYKYFDDDKYLNVAKDVAGYIEREIINKADYFSSTLDARCEDKEASLYAATALYYLGLVSDGEEKQHYLELAEKASYFVLSWYYLWDVPFAEGQMLGDIGLKSRGWGNVSVENNHIDVFIFQFVDVLNWLTTETGKSYFSDFGKVIYSSMKDQLLPYRGRMCGIAKEGYYPEVVQHTNWDYGKNGKGYYNDIFAPGWVVASLWELLTPGRAEQYLTD